MRVALDPPLRLAGCTIAAISEIRASGDTLGPALWGSGAKRPVLVLIAKGTELRATRPDGTPVEMSEVEQGFAEPIARFRALVSDDA